MSLKIDGHQHFWKYDPVKYSWIDERMSSIRKDFLPEDLEPALRNSGIQGTVAVEAFHSEKETERLLDLTSQSSFIKAVVGWIDLTAEDVEERLGYFARNPYFKGVRHTVYDQRGEFLTDPDFQNGIKVLGKYQLTYDLLVFDYQLPGAIELVKNFPQQMFVLDHMGKPEISREGPNPEWSANMEKLAGFSNVYCKMSGLLTETEDFVWEPGDFVPYLETVFNAFGEDKIMFGSNWPVCLAAGTYSDTVNLVKTYCSNLPIEVQEKIFGRNAMEFYRI